MSVLVVAEHLQGQVREVTGELVTAAVEFGGPIAVAVVGKNPCPLIAQVNKPGVDEIVTVEAGASEFENDIYQAALETLIESLNPRLILLGFTVNSMGYAPAVAAKLGLGLATDVFAFRDDAGSIVAERSFYGAKVNAELEFPGREQVMLLLRAGTWAPAEGVGAAAARELAAVPSVSRARHRAFVEAPAGDVDITTADFLMSVGRGVGAKENLEQFEQLASKMGATLSVSRPLVDAGWVSSARQVGQSGKTVKPKVYLALGISGAVQHLAGMKTSDTIIAVNTDPEAAIFSVADYGAACNLFDVADELEELDW